MSFLTNLRHSYNLRRKRLILLTGGINDLFQKGNDFLSLEQRLYQEFASKFSVVRFDISSGISFYSNRDVEDVARVCENLFKIRNPKFASQNLEDTLARSHGKPLVGLTYLEQISQCYIDMAPEYAKEGKTLKPLLVIMQYSGTLFPAKETAQLAEIDRQRLATFLNWVKDPQFKSSSNVVIMINETRSGINSMILGQPMLDSIEIPLPDDKLRRDYTRSFLNVHQEAKYEGHEADFVKLTAGLDLTSIRDLLIVSEGTKEPVTAQTVVEEVNRILEVKLEGVAKKVNPSHGPEDIIGYKETGRIVRKILKRCQKQKTAVSAIIVGGPNGAGKSFQMEAYAAASGWIVIELTGLRSKWYGGTDEKWEILRWFISTFGKVLILVDEAHTAFGDVHSSTEHTTEKRLAGNMIKLMGDPQFKGKALWAMMTSRPDELNPDVKSRSPIQIPIFDLEGEPRKEFVKQMFARANIAISDDELELIMVKTEYYSARDYSYFVAEVLAWTDDDPQMTPLGVLDIWQASGAITEARDFQRLVAAQHCSYPGLLPSDLRSISSSELVQKIEDARFKLRY